MLKENYEMLEGNDKFEGYCIDLLEEINNIFPFNYNISLARDGAYGAYNNKTKQWSGMVAELINGVRNQTKRLFTPNMEVTSGSDDMK